ncbi:hypothetical protein DFJ58DRAFT_729328 [Suillus subalutaceus]|uniref:uncharacterized protein n=1 Tax=Suillus subalutaceus TaxID=48586 RepID=UPI001B87B058|nr:uncharacterized protein DFJ58DRAFT_729328 [Suillus subalutaceus]KAG1850233.1 hypothetical protein DFJ58DRAFT_729328 [Suillus subalutaceus]
MPQNAFNETRAELADFLFQNPGNFRFTTSIESDALTLSFQQTPFSHLLDSPSDGAASIPSPPYSPVLLESSSDSQEGSIVAPGPELNPVGDSDLGRPQTISGIENNGSHALEDRAVGGGEWFGRDGEFFPYATQIQTLTDSSSTSAPRFGSFTPSDVSITAGPCSYDSITHTTASITAGPRPYDSFTPTTASITAGPCSFDSITPTTASITAGPCSFDSITPSTASITAGPRSFDSITPTTASITAGPHSFDSITPATASIIPGLLFNLFMPLDVSFTSGLCPPGLLNPSIMSNTAGLYSTAPPDVSNTISDQIKVSNIPSVSESRDSANESLIPPIASIGETVTTHETRIAEIGLSLLAETALDNTNENDLSAPQTEPTIDTSELRPPDEPSERPFGRPEGELVQVMSFYDALTTIITRAGLAESLETISTYQEEEKNKKEAEQVQSPSSITSTPPPASNNEFTPP